MLSSRELAHNNSSSKIYICNMLTPLTLSTLGITATTTTMHELSWIPLIRFRDGVNHTHTHTTRAVAGCYISSTWGCGPKVTFKREHYKNLKQRTTLDAETPTKVGRTSRRSREVRQWEREGMRNRNQEHSTWLTFSLKVKLISLYSKESIIKTRAVHTNFISN